jgi:hypothetical protein
MGTAINTDDPLHWLSPWVNGSILTLAIVRRCIGITSAQSIASCDPTSFCPFVVEIKRLRHRLVTVWETIPTGSVDQVSVLNGLLERTRKAHHWINLGSDASLRKEESVLPDGTGPGVSRGNCVGPKHIQRSLRAAESVQPKGPSRADSTFWMNRAVRFRDRY